MFFEQISDSSEVFADIIGTDSFLHLIEFTLGILQGFVK